MKVCIDVTLSLLVETDLEGVDNIVNNIDFHATPNTENVEVCENEVTNYQITGYK
jgi:hypothetical protein